MLRITFIIFVMRIDEKRLRHTCKHVKVTYSH